LRENLASARDLGAQVEVLSGFDAVEAILKFARRKGITQIFIGQSRREGAWRRLWSNFIDRLIHSAEGIDVSVYPQ
jgi:K+-sensing histidine kinase KdpD